MESCSVKEMSKMTDYFFIGCVVVGVLYALFVLFRSTSWPSVEGVMVESSYKRNTYIGSTELVAVGRPRFDYDINVVYEYSVGGKKYIGNKLFASMPNNIDDGKLAEEMVEKYPKGAIVRVYFDPSNPKHSYLESMGEVSVKHKVIIALFFLFVIACASGVLYLFKKMA